MRCALAALMFAPAAVSAAVLAPDASDTRAGAQPLQSGITAALDHPGDRDWYSLRGQEIGREIPDTVRIDVGLPGTGCTAARPLLVALYNPEGRWMRRYAASTRTSIPFPTLPSRYYLKVRAADAGCVGLQYEVSTLTTGGGGSAVVGDAAFCRIARSYSARVARQIRRLQNQRRHSTSPAARRRYTRYLRTQRREFTRARANQRRACARFGEPVRART